MQQTALNQTGLHALGDRLDKKLLKEFGAPPRPGFGEHTMMGNFGIQIEAQEPKEIQADTNLLHQFALAADIVEEEQEQQFNDDPRIQRDITGAAIVVPNGGNDKAKVEGAGDLAQEVVGIDSLLQIDMVGEKRRLPVTG